MLRSSAVEKQRLLLVLLAGSLAGLITGYWAICLLIATSIYLLWHLQQLNALTRWLKRGASLKRIPDLSGAWAPLVHYVYTIQRRNRKRKDQMRSLLKRFEQISLALPDATVVLSSNNEIDWSNKVAGNLLGIYHPHDRGHRLDNLIRNPEFHRYLAAGKFKQPLNIPSPVFEDVELSIRIIPFGKNERLLTARDISTFSQMQAMRRDFVANVSHELRTPLTVISGYLESLVDESKLDNDMKMALQAVQQQSSRMQHIVEDLLELARLENARTQLSEGEVHMPSIFAALLEEVKPMALVSNHELIADIDDNLYLRGGETEMSSLVSNLIHNAIRHTPSGSKIWVSWAMDSQTQEAVLTVKDNGQGIEREHIPRLTERFYRVDPGRSRDVGGSGLGLSIIKHIMLRHDAVLHIQSELEQGTEFTCVFPAERTVFLPNTKRA